MVMLDDHNGALRLMGMAPFLFSTFLLHSPSFVVHNRWIMAFVALQYVAERELKR
jgi:hypothetical protein